ncbi:uncharacterized protein LOC100577771 isoform X2 [Apis mellifera]|uniref:Uncharacterized protein LOC100577771 isoform X2 n=1 Tax=Apis mellifera TaxID=7460 RepID=A0A7M7GDR6_APIME|nr:uncharacterized protein LOC100577771 isoform X2 [Apis mellifera]|eukprot:XP_003249415.1 uncharacterized protein LOC100577771 isoform X2 [Apis mellifera]
MVMMTTWKIVPQSLIFWLMILGTWHCTGEKLSPDQKAPLFARGSGGLILNTPFEDNKARNRPISNVNAPVDNVQKEETEMLKLVDGELVRTVKGSFSYKSPEGLPISVKYEADENGNRASFKFGTGVANGDNRSSSSSKSENGRGDKNGRSSYLPPTKKDVDRSYLPPQ